MPTRLEIKGLKETLDSLEYVSEQLTGAEMFQAMQQATIIVANDAKRFSPVDTGRLRGSIGTHVVLEGLFNKKLVGIIGTPVVYSPFMEYGTGTPAGNPRVKMPPPAALTGWARRHRANPYMIARAIYNRGGLTPRYFFKRSVERNAQRVANLLGQRVSLIIQRS